MNYEAYEDGHGSPNASRPTPPRWGVSPACGASERGNADVPVSPDGLAVDGVQRLHRSAHCGRVGVVGEQREAIEELPGRYDLDPVNGAETE